MAIIQAFAVEKQKEVLQELRIPFGDSSENSTVHIPLTFGVYYAGCDVRMSVYFILGEAKYFCHFPPLSLHNKAANVLKMFAVMKVVYININIMLLLIH